MSNKMIKCKTCGAEIAKSAKTCPQCGAKNVVLHPVLGLAAGLVAIFLCVLINSLISGGGESPAKTSGGGAPDYEDVTSMFIGLRQNAEVSVNEINDRLGVVVTFNDIDSNTTPENWDGTISDFTSLLIDGNKIAQENGFQLLSAEIRSNDGTVIASGGNGECTFNKFSTSSPHVSNGSVSVSAKDLWDAYEKNKVNADNLYKDKLLSVNGVIYDIGQDLLTKKPCVTLITTTVSGTDLCLSPIECYFPDDDDLVSKISDLSDGDRITIFGTCEGVPILNVQLSNCYF